MEKDNSLTTLVKSGVAISAYIYGLLVSTSRHIAFGRKGNKQKKEKKKYTLLFTSLVVSKLNCQNYWGKESKQEFLV